MVLKLHYNGQLRLREHWNVRFHHLIVDKGPYPSDEDVKKLYVAYQ